MSAPARRDYPAELVKRVRDLYESGLTIVEVDALVPGCDVKRLMIRHGIPRRPAQPRDRSGPANTRWLGDGAGYAALHLRVTKQRGRPSVCEWCGVTEGRFEWANISGNYADAADYDRLCVKCHRAYDAERRRQTGRRTMPGGAA